jgi:hypothetical protein
MRLKRAVGTSVAVMAVVSLSAGTAIAGHSAFSDAAGTHEAGIHWMADTGITAGCGGSRFCSDDAVKRSQMATFMHRLSGTSNVAPVVNADKVDGFDAEQLRGQTGPQGPQGPEGPQGLTGPQGPAGPADDDVYYSINEPYSGGAGGAFCDPGDIAVSGGFLQFDGPFFPISDIHFFDEETQSDGWLVGFEDSSGSFAGNGSVEVTCQVADVQNFQSSSITTRTPADFKAMLAEVLDARRSPSRTAK